jgi:hypothetical protein
VIKRIWKRVFRWIEQILSAGGKEVLIKLVSQAIPMFSMSFLSSRVVCARILKVAYFTNGDLMKASLGSRPSYIWRAVLEGQDALKIGMIK